MSILKVFAMSVAVLFGLAQVLGSSGIPLGASTAFADIIGGAHDPLVVAQDDDDDSGDDEDDSEDDEDDSEDDEDDSEDDEDDSEDDEDDSGDDEDEDEDSDDEDDSEDDEDDDEDSDDGGTAASAPLQTFAALPSNEVSGRSTGGDSSLNLGERVELRVFPWMPAGVTIKMRAVDPTTVAAPPGSRVGDLVFRIEAQDANGQTLNTLPAEVNLSARYNESEVARLNESNVTLSRLNSTNNQWQGAPKLVRETNSNYVAASITELGVYAVHVP